MGGPVHRQAEESPPANAQGEIESVGPWRESAPQGLGGSFFFGYPSVLDTYQHQSFVVPSTMILACAFMVSLSSQGAWKGSG